MNLTVVLEGKNPNDRLEFEPAGVVPKDGSIQYSVSGMIGYHHNVIDYLRACAEAGKVKVADAVFEPRDATVLHELFSISGKTVRKVTLVVNRKDPTAVEKYGAIYATLESTKVNLQSVLPVTGDSGRTFYIVNFETSPGTGIVNWDR